ncbi:MAG: hypothetical protein DMD42_02360 [Gemmatimonadetes bacterium]|nr:MAG: hypothetical protein DMD42_02360 [Gemmatimonadota bacterium]
MRPSRAVAVLTLLVGSVIVGTCAYPTERDSSVHVSITPVRILFSGHDTVVAARAWELRGLADSQTIPNVVFVWSTSDPTVATVDAGRIVGIKSGTAIIRAAALNFDRGQFAAADTVRVSAPLEIDSVAPDTARYGQVVTVFGPGADKVVLASMKGALFLYPYPFSAQHDTTGYGQQKFWIPPPAESDRITFIGNGIVTASADSTHVVKRDVYEPNDTAPHHFDLDAPRPFPYPGTVYNLLLVFNPALFFEPLKRGATFGADWYRFRHSTARDLTIILTAPSAPGTFQTFVTDSLAWTGTTYAIGPGSWTFGPASHACHGARFSPSEAAAESTIVAFKNAPAGVLHAIAIYGQPASYGLAVVDTYASELPPDAHEDDNSCNAADSRDTMQAPFRDTLTIENPHDVDWIRFHYVNGGLGTSAQFRLHAFPGTHPDSLKDLDVNRTTSLATGDYYLAVVDFAGTTTTYEVCVGTVPVLGGGFCNTAFPSPPATSGRSAPLRARRLVRGRMRVAPSLVPSRR